MGKWDNFTHEERLATLEELVRRVAAQMIKVIDEGEHTHIRDSVVVSSGDLHEQVSMFRLDDASVGLYEVGVVAQRANMPTNLVLGIRVFDDDALGTFSTALVVHGFIVDGDSAGYFVHLRRDDQGVLQRVGGLRRLEEGQDTGDVERQLVIPFLQGRYSGQAELPRPAAGKTQHSRRAPKRNILSAHPGSFWIEVNK